MWIGVDTDMGAGSVPGKMRSASGNSFVLGNTPIRSPVPVESSRDSAVGGSAD